MPAGNVCRFRAAGSEPLGFFSLTDERALELVALDDALSELAGLSARQAEIVELRYFAGLTVEESAHKLGLSPATVKREWEKARAWLHARMRGFPI